MHLGTGLGEHVGVAAELQRVAGPRLLGGRLRVRARARARARARHSRAARRGWAAPCVRATVSVVLVV